MKNRIETKKFMRDVNHDHVDRNLVCTRAVELRQQGFKNATLIAAREYGCSRGSVYNWMGRLGYSQAYFNS